MSKDYNVLAPGPVNLHPEILKTLSLPTIHHRTPEFEQVFKDVLNRLKLVFKTKQPCFVLTSTGSGGMEALTVNTINPKDRVLCLVAGKFGERWAEMTKTFGADVTEIKLEWGKAYKKAQLEVFLKDKPDFDAVLIQHCETSTATSFDIKELASIFKNKKTLFLVDAITSLGALELNMDEWGLDGVVGGSQKAFMLPTGLSLISFSEKAWKKINSNTTPKYYFDIKKELAANQKFESFFSSNVFLIRALQKVLTLFEASGIESLILQISQRAQFCREAGLYLNWKLYSESPSNSVTAFLLPNEINSQSLRDLLEKDYQITVMGGQDQAKGKIIRIGHMGYITAESMEKLFLYLYDLLTDVYGQKLITKPEFTKKITDLRKKYLKTDEFN